MVLKRLFLITSGVRDWWLQRLSALVIFTYVAIIFYNWLTKPQAGFTYWHDLILSSGMVMLGSAVVVSIVVHAWLGFWMVATDYIKNKLLKRLFLTAVLAVLALEAGWALYILWGFK